MSEPAESSTTSPGTMASIGMVTVWPSRRTLERTWIRWRSFSIARVAENSCRKLKMELPRITSRMMPASTHSRTKADTEAATTRISSSGLLNWASNRRMAEDLDWAVRVLGPVAASCWRARSEVSPLGVVLSFCRSSSDGRLQ